MSNREQQIIREDRTALQDRSVIYRYCYLRSKLDHVSGIYFVSFQETSVSQVAR